MYLGMFKNHRFAMERNLFLWITITAKNMLLLSCYLFYTCWKDYIEQFTANFTHSPAVPWCPLSSLMIWWWWYIEIHPNLVHYLFAQSLAWFGLFFSYTQESGALPNGATSISAKVSHNEKCYKCFLGWKWETKALIRLAYYCMC